MLSFPRKSKGIKSIYKTLELSYNNYDLKKEYVFKTIKIEIEDNGPGMDDEVRKKIFKFIIELTAGALS